ncbi:unnamed protein product [Lactuca virosa]|uniref:Uncharacterized protein n=1 Tax=Lactuca virosa TaxID=75947 RepID=A0AAU9N8X6_9ASTR|nr:unnamed protein product [Lactuca virosa]
MLVHQLPPASSSPSSYLPIYSLKRESNKKDVGSGLGFFWVSGFSQFYLSSPILICLFLSRQESSLIIGNFLQFH